MLSEGKKDTCAFPLTPSYAFSFSWQNSITSEWSGTWLVLRKSQRRLIFVSEATGNVEKMDLRKARCIGEYMT